MSDDKHKLYRECPVHIDTIIANLVAQQARLSDRIDRCWDDPAQLVRLLPLYGQNTTRLSRFLRDRCDFYGNPDDETLASESDPDPGSLPIQIDDLIADLAAKQTRLSQHLDRCWQNPDAEHLDRLLAIYSQNATRLGRLLHDRYAIYGPPPNPFSVVIDQALDRLSEEWGIEL